MSVADQIAPVMGREEKIHAVSLLGRVRGVAFDAVVVAGLTFVLGGVTTAMLEEPVNTYLIPAALQLVGKELRLNLYKQEADGKVKLDACFQLLVPPWSGSGRLIEIKDPTVCSAASTSKEEAKQLRTVGYQGGGILSFSFTHFDDEFGGGSFHGDSITTPGVYTGILTAQAHEDGTKCALTQYWGVAGKAKFVKDFQTDLENRIAHPDGSGVSILANRTADAGTDCKYKKASISN
jgi:hypothetical protein